MRIISRVVAYLRSALRDADAAREMSHALFAEMLGGGRTNGGFICATMGGTPNYNLNRSSLGELGAAIRERLQGR